MRLTLIHPCIGRRVGQRYIKTWQMEPLPAATIAGLTPPEVDLVFYDDRMEEIPFDEPTDLVAMSVETYTARRAYQIASEYRRRGVPVVMGGFHATLCPHEVARHAEAVVVGEAEAVWPALLADAEGGALDTFYQGDGRPSLTALRPDRSIFRGKSYLPVSLVEVSRGCPYRCEFCAVQTVFQGRQTRRPADDVLGEIERLGNRRVLFFVDDNLTVDPSEAKAFLRELARLKVRWVSQVSIDAAHDEELLAMMAQSGCLGVLIGFETLSQHNLSQMRKGFNLTGAGYGPAVANLRRHGIRVYSTFVFGYDEDTESSFGETVAFAKRHRFYIAAFNHLTPFPGTPLYHRLEDEGRLRYEQWWLDPAYSYNTVPFHPASISADGVQRGCVEARAAFYGWRSIMRRGMDRVNRADRRMWWQFYVINYALRREVQLRDHYPLGDEAWRGELLEVRRGPVTVPGASGREGRDPVTVPGASVREGPCT